MDYPSVVEVEAVGAVAVVVVARGVVEDAAAAAGRVVAVEGAADAAAAVPRSAVEPAAVEPAAVVSVRETMSPAVVAERRGAGNGPAPAPVCEAFRCEDVRISG